MNILCVGGCNNDITPVLSLIRNLLNFGRITISAILLIIAVVFLVKCLLDKTKKAKEKHFKKAGLFLLISLGVFLVFTTGLVIFGIATSDNYDDKAQCWCK